MTEESKKWLDVKSSLIEQLIKTTEAELSRAQSARQSSQKDAIEAEGAMLSRYDTMKEESQYLENAFARVVTEQKRNLQRLRVFITELKGLAPTGRASLGSLCKVEQEYDDGEVTTRRIFLAPVAGGASLEMDGEVVKVMTPTSPMGNALLGRSEEEDFEIRIADRQVYVEVVEVK